MNTFELVRMFFPDADDMECDFRLWETTCYPMGNYSNWLCQLRSSKRAILEGKLVCDRCGGHYKKGASAKLVDLCNACGIALGVVNAEAKKNTL